MKRKLTIVLIAVLCVAIAALVVACNDKDSLESIALAEGTQFAPVVKGTEPDLNGKKLVATYKDGSTREIEITREMLTGFDNQKLGEQKVTVTYTEGEKTVTTEITLTVVEKSLQSVNVKTKPATTEYVAGERFYAYGMEIEAVYNDGTRAAVTDYTVEPATLAADTSEVTVSYQGKTATVAVTVTEPAVTVKNAAELTAALEEAEEGSAIAINGTIGSADRASGYTIFRVTKGVKLVGIGEEKPVIYGSVFVDADNVTVRGLRINNRGWVTGDSVTAHRNGLTAVSNKVTVEHNEFVAPAEDALDATQAIANGLILYAGTDEGSAVVIRDNSFTGYGYENENWSSVAVNVVAGLAFPYNAQNTAGASASVKVSVDAREIIDSSRFTDCSECYIYSDYSAGGYNVYLYAYSVNAASLESVLTYAHPDGITVELAPGTYELSKPMNVDNVTLIGLGKEPVVVSGGLSLGENSETVNITIDED